MDLNSTQKNWNALGKDDALFGVLSHPGKQGSKWDQAEFFETGVREVDALWSEAEHLGIHIPRRRALDFGCAVGRLSQALALHFDEVVGVDISEAMLEKAVRFNRFGSRCHYLHNRAPDLQILQDESMDLVYSNIVLQHMEPRYAKGYIVEFLRVLSSQGLLVFQVPLKSQYSSLRLAFKKLIPRPLLRFYRRWRYGITPVQDVEIEMNGISEAEVCAWITSHGGSILQASRGWYWVVKLVLPATSS